MRIRDPQLPPLPQNPALARATAPVRYLYPDENWLSVINHARSDTKLVLVGPGAFRVNTYLTFPKRQLYGINGAILTPEHVRSGQKVVILTGDSGGLADRAVFSGFIVLGRLIVHGTDRWTVDDNIFFDEVATGSVITIKNDAHNCRVSNNQGYWKGAASSGPVGITAENGSTYNTFVGNRFHQWATALTYRGSDGSVDAACTGVVTIS